VEGISGLSPGHTEEGKGREEGRVLVMEKALNF